jgi:2-oxoglutarate ferredoxin oxidoreductase subunit gamma
MMAQLSVRLAGTGGQGLILAGLILAEAAAKHHNRNVVQTNSYGPEARGGASKSDVILSDDPIYNPNPERLDVLVVLSQPAYDKYRGHLRKGGTLIYDTSQVRLSGGEEGFGADITGMAEREAGATIVANVVALGLLAGATGVVTAEAMESAVLARVPAKARDLNRKALALGLTEGRRLGGGKEGR